MSKKIIESRHCKRAFLDQPVAPSLLADIFISASHAASSKNTQPWQVAVVTGTTKDQLVKAMCKKFDADEFDGEDYTYMIDPMPPEFKQRARECGYGIYQTKGISREDSAARKAHFRENYTFFNAPVGLIFHLPKGAERGNFLDMGAFMQNVMLGITAEGLGACPQFSISAYSKTIRQILKLNARIIVCGMAVGYPDESAIVNTFIPNRLPVEAFTTWHD
ncbi:MAG: nitroreductase [Candidatus Margulisiibacteriota bacterium]